MQLLAAPFLINYKLTALLIFYLEVRFYRILSAQVYVLC